MLSLLETLKIDPQWFVNLYDKFKNILSKYRLNL